MQCLAELCQLAVGKVTERPARDRAELERPDPRSDQLENRVAHFVEHLADNPVAPLVDDDPNDRAILGVTDWPDHLRRCPLAIDDDPASQPVEGLWRRVAVQQRLVLLVDPVARMHDAVGDLAVVGQQQQAFGLPVQPADRDDPLVDGNEVHNGVAAALVGGCRDVATRLVEQNVPPANDRDELPVDFDLLGARVDLRA
jgi:hypothetical protein